MHKFSNHSQFSRIRPLKHHEIVWNRPSIRTLNKPLWRPASQWRYAHNNVPYLSERLRILTKNRNDCFPFLLILNKHVLTRPMIPIVLSHCVPLFIGKFEWIVGRSRTSLAVFLPIQLLPTKTIIFSYMDDRIILSGQSTFERKPLNRLTSQLVPFSRHTGFVWIRILIASAQWLTTRTRVSDSELVPFCWPGWRLHD